MAKLAPLPRIIGVAPRWPILEHQHQRSSSAYVSATGEEIAANEGFKDAGFAAALAANDGDVREGDFREVDAGCGEDVLEFVDDWDE